MCSLHRTGPILGLKWTDFPGIQSLWWGLSVWLVDVWMCTGNLLTGTATRTTLGQSTDNVERAGTDIFMGVGLGFRKVRKITIK